MTTPCRKCGSVRIASLRHNLLRAAIKLSGLRLAACAECGRWRMMPRTMMKGRHRGSSHSSQLELFETPAPTVATVEVIRPSKKTSAGAACPSCGSREFRRSHRTFWENLAGSPPMMRCRKCRHRFPWEHDRVKAA